MTWSGRRPGRPKATPMTEKSLPAYWNRTSWRGSSLRWTRRRERACTARRATAASAARNSRAGGMTLSGGGGAPRGGRGGGRRRGGARGGGGGAGRGRGATGPGGGAGGQAGVGAGHGGELGDLGEPLGDRSALRVGRHRTAGPVHGRADAAGATEQASGAEPGGRVVGGLPAVEGRAALLQARGVVRGSVRAHESLERR